MTRIFYLYGIKIVHNLRVMKKILLIVSIVVIIAFLGYRPVNSARQNCRHISGVVSSVSEAGTNDALIKLDGTDDNYYINRGLESRLALEDLRKEVLGKQVVISYAKHWTFIPQRFSKHISELKMGSNILYSEFVPIR